MNVLNWLKRPVCRTVDEDRWVVLDMETTGLDPQRDEVLFVSALAMHRSGGRWSVVAQDSLDLLIRPRAVVTSAENVLVHGLGLGVQSRGTSPAQALLMLRQWVADSPVLAFHADFDRSFLSQACKRERLEPMPWHWLDIADVLPIVFPKIQAQTLDQWMAVLNVPCSRRHHAAADAWATAQLWLLMVQSVPGQQQMQWRQWRQFVKQGRWLSGRLIL
jgi:DNA polymerase-3 subunit epsilon